MKTANASTRVLLALALITIALGASLSQAEEVRGKGLFIGVNAGFGSSALHYKTPLGDVTTRSMAPWEPCVSATPFPRSSPSASKATASVPPMRTKRTGA